MPILILLWIMVFFLGAAVFSFVQVVAWRLPRKLNYVTGRSMCPACQKELRWYQNIPLFGYLGLRGKCGFCKAKISPQYFFMELLGGVLSLFTFCFFTGLYSGENAFNFAYDSVYEFLLVFALLCVLTAVLLVDLETMEIPNGFSIWIALLGIGAIFLFPQVSLLERGIGILSVSVPLFLIAYFIEGAFGGGDIKLMAALGLFLGWKLNLFALFVALLVGGGCAVYLLVSKKRTGKQHMPFGPSLCIGAATALFCGDWLIAWYLGLFGL